MNDSDGQERQNEEARRRLRGPPGFRAHLMGIGGVGMAALARLLAARGARVSGCDAAQNDLSRALERDGVRVHAGHDPAHVADGVDAVIRSAAVPADHPEALAAEARGLPVLTRGAVLPALLEGRFSVAVGGTHGKTTTTAMIAQIARRAGRRPAFAIGGAVDALGGVAADEGGPLIVEADESDGTLRLYEPDVAVVTNVDFDHMERFAGMDELAGVFRRFARQARRRVIYGADNDRARAVCADLPNAVGFGFGPAAALRASDRRARGLSQTFEVEWDGRPLGRVSLPVPGEHNALNALAAMAAAAELGVAPEVSRDALDGFHPARRRLECVVDGSVRVFSDYAHHPAEIRALIASLRDLPRRRLVAVFQPHRYTRTRALGAEFPAAFDGVDELVLAPVYAASEAPVEGGRAEDLLRRFGTPPRVPVTLAPDLRAAWDRIRARIGEGDVLLVIGAGDVERIASWAAAWAAGAGGLQPPNP